MRCISILALTTTLAFGCRSDEKPSDSGFDANPYGTTDDGTTTATGGDDGGTTDGGTTGSGTTDGGSEDSGTDDGGSDETGSPDTGSPDTGSLDTGDSAPCTDFTMTLIDGETLEPSVVRLGVKLQCDGEPVTDKTEGDFSILENDLPISSFESSLSVVPTVAAFRLSTAMVLDMSGSIVDSGFLDDLQVAATTFVDRLGDDQEVAIYLFDGRADLETLIEFTNDHEAVNAAIASLDDYEVADPGTNLNGAIVSGLEILDGIEAGTTEGMLNASMVLFTDGTDTSSRVSNEAAVLAVESSDHSVYAVGLGSEVDADHMTAVGPAGFYSATDITALEDAFDEVATTIRNEASSIYILAYCSPKRAGDHTLELQLTGTEASAIYIFNSDGFDLGCDPTDFVPPDFLDLDEDGYRPYDGDCDDEDASRHPGVTEICDGIDNDCDGDTDEELLITVYADEDGDGFGRTVDAIIGCDGVSGYVETDGDCNDSDPAIHPEADELCDDIDNNCNDIIDDIPEDMVFTYYVDADGDGFGADGSSTGMSACLPPDGFVTIDGDCDDTAYAINPDASEYCDDEDNDCDDSVDEDAVDALTWYADEDEDGLGDPTTGVTACSAEEGWVTDDSDCDDTSTISCTLDSCLEYREAGFSESGTYTINGDGDSVEVYCDMETDGGGWTYIVDFDASEGCPIEWTSSGSAYGATVCKRNDSGFRDHTFSALGVEYTQVRGVIQGAFRNSSDGLWTPPPSDMAEGFADGIGVIAGEDEADFVHLHTLVLGHAGHHCSRTPPAFFGENYTCIIGSRSGSHFSGPYATSEWVRTLDTSSGAGITIRLMADSEVSDEDIAIETARIGVR